jgi:thiosulfate/3-mercaptopyruvate sulfurtransferase
LSEARNRTLISVEDLASRLDAGSGIVLLHVRDENTGKPAESGLIPGAIDVYLASDVSGPPAGSGAKRPLPDIGVLEANARRWGVKPDSLVVVYDDTSGAQASRAWWTLKWADFHHVRILDGGVNAWKASGRAVVSEPSPPPGGGTISLSPGHMPTMGPDEAAAMARQGVLLDARGKAAYVGGPVEPGKPATGHIPGAILAPSTGNIGADGRFKPHDELRAGFAQIGADGSKSVGVYCGSGNAAAHAVAALHAAGVDAVLYVGSWSEWSADPSRPVATGPEPG